MNMIKKTIILFSALFCLVSCKITKSLNELKKENATIYNYAYDGKDIVFLPMHHLGKKEFYDDVQSKVTEYKGKGYRVYYEQISTKLDVDSLQNDIIKRKVRKIKGSNLNYEEQAKGSFLEKYVKQPKYPDLGITDSDLRADINYLQFINYWEQVNGKIVLNNDDLNTPLDKNYEKDKFYSTSQYNAVVIDYRNSYLVDLIKNNKDNKILILYGEGHRADLEKKLKQ